MNANSGTHNLLCECVVENKYVKNKKFQIMITKHGLYLFYFSFFSLFFIVSLYSLPKKINNNNNKYIIVIKNSCNIVLSKFVCKRSIL